MARLVLVGLPGVGKSSVARALSARWDCEARDTDDVVAERVQTSVATYLVTHGEEAFRERELEALGEVLDLDAVVATGAGVVTTRDARNLLSAQLTLWLDCDDQVLLERVRDGERPLLGDDHRRALADLRHRRADLYRSCARLCVDASGTLDEVVAQVMNEVESVAP